MVFCCFGEDIFDQKRMIFIDQVLFYLVYICFCAQEFDKFEDYGKRQTRLKSTLIHTAFVQAYRCLVCSIFLLFKQTVCNLTGETLKH